MISAVVLTKNEEKNIKQCLESLRWCDQTVVVDDYSEDKTRKIAQKMGAKVYQRHLDNNFAAQRNFALRQAQNEWVLFVDADERISEASAAEIQDKVLSIKYKGFYFRRLDFWGGRWLKHGETASVRLLRLARKGMGEWKRKVHEIWQVEGKIGELRNPLLHYPHQSLSEFLTDINFHSTLHAQALYQEGVRPSPFRLVANPLGKFFQNYFWRRGFLDGTPGLIVTLMMSFHSFLARGKLYLRWKK